MNDADAASKSADTTGAAAFRSTDGTGVHDDGSPVTPTSVPEISKMSGEGTNGEVGSAESGERPAQATETAGAVQDEASVSRALTRKTVGETHPVAGVSPMTRRIVIGAGRAGLNIANGILLSRNAVLNPVVSAALVAYECFQAVRDYHTGAVNRLGYQTSRTDTALRIGKSVGLAGIGMGIGQAVGMLVGLSAIPVAGQIVLTAVLSVGVGICVGTLLTRHIDRMFARWQIRSQYGYPADEHGARRRFEELLEERHDLCTFETCKIVQHYADYRVASGWESSNDIDDYRATGDIRSMPVSFQHFAIVQLQRKWGFLNDHGACKKVFKMLILQHHPDRGGSTEMAALLNRDYEIYAFCQGWDEDCPNLLSPDGAGGGGEGSPAGRPQKRNVVVDFLRSIFRSSSTTDAEASDLHQFGLLTLEAGTRSELHRLDELEELGDDENKSFASAAPNGPSGGAAGAVREGGGASGTAKQRSIARVLSALQQTYQMTSEAITFSGLARVAQDKEKWIVVRKEVALFNRMQCFIRVAHEDASTPSSLPTSLDVPEGDGESEGGGIKADDVPPASPAASREHTCLSFRWRTVTEAIDRREQARAAIIGAVFSPEVSEQLEAALGLWKSAQSLSQSYFKQCAAERQREMHSASADENDGAGQTLETLVSIQRKMQKLAREVNDPWQRKEKEWAAGSLHGSSTLMEDLREVGLTASYALAGEHAKTVVGPRTSECNTYFGAWARKRSTVETVLRELRGAMAERERWRHKRATNAATVEETDAALEELQQQINNFTSQLVLLQQHQSEIDAKVAELAEICICHLPEAIPILGDLPSTCARVVGKGSDGPSVPRRLQYERERTLMCYQRVELEPPNKMAPPHDPSSAFPHELVQPRLFKAVHTDALTGIVSFCWIKSYFFPDKPESSLEDIDTDDDAALGRSGGGDGEHRKLSAGARGRKAAQDEILQQILDAELAVSEGCHSKFILSPTDVFCDPERRRVFFQVPRGATQQRFSSVYEVRKRVRPLGLRWLLDAMQCLIDLHSCQLVHGHVTLSSFTFDDFGNTALGFFAAASRREASERGTDHLEEEELSKDVIDFGAMILSDVLPYLFGGTADVHLGASPPPPTFPSTAQPPQQLSATDHQVARIFREVGERLIGKEDPRWSLLQARIFVRRCLQFSLPTDESAFLFTKEVSYPVHWGPLRALMPQLVSRKTNVVLSGTPTAKASIFLNVNVPLWEVYWICRRKMAEGRMGTFSTPPAFQKAKPPLPCSDDCEVNERFLWLPCRTEEEAWNVCQSGFPRARRKVAERDGTHAAATRTDDTIRLRLTIATKAPTKSVSPPLWGIVCRVAVGTVVSTSANPSFVAPPVNDSDDNDADGHHRVSADKITFAVKRRCHLEENGDEVADAILHVPCPWGRCFPEYVVRWSRQ